MDINGKWTGTLIYGTGYSENIIGKELNFELTIDESDGDITGQGKDVSGFGINPSEFNIKGFVEDSTISFIKQYKSAAYFDEEDKLVLIPNEPSLEITYNGIFNMETNEFEGEWDMLITHVQQGENWFEEECTGTWSMRKV